ncbi:hypothetical protein T492DRAFT_1090788 [Pavlovales sp. CCMP2436]|nr:hypothetical protein T492DRAFT_1090788 [Pavlovales sp. CCMP2436]
MGPPVSCWTVEPLFWRRGGRRARGGDGQPARVLAGGTGAGLCTSTGHSTTPGSLGLWPCAQRSRPMTSRLMGAAALRATRTSDSFTFSSFRICSPPQTASPLPSAFSTRIGIERGAARYPAAAPPSPARRQLPQLLPETAFFPLVSARILQPPPLLATASASPRPPRSACHRRAERNIERDARQLAHRTPMGPCGIYSVRWDLVQITSAGRRREPRDIVFSGEKLLSCGFLRGAY